MLRSNLALVLTVVALNFTIQPAKAEPGGEPLPPTTNQNLTGQVVDLNIDSEPPAPSGLVPNAQGKQILASTDGDTPDVMADILELKRTSGDTITLKFAINNGSSENFDFSYNYGNGSTSDYGTIGGVHLLDPTNKKKYLAIRDSNGKCVCSTGLSSIAPGAKKNLWAKFPAPPANVTKLSIGIPHFIPVDDVPLG